MGGLEDQFCDDVACEQPSKLYHVCTTAQVTSYRNLLVEGASAKCLLEERPNISWNERGIFFLKSVDFMIGVKKH